MGYTFDYTVQPDGTAALARAYGEEPVLTLPGALPGPEGQMLPLAKLGNYCFSGTVRDGVSGPVLRCSWDGEGLPGPARPADGAEELHPVAGNFLEEITLPESLREIGSCAFYNCRALRRMTLGSGPLAVGSDVFLNCFVLTEIRVCAPPEAATGLSAIVNNISSNLRVSFLPEGPEGETAAVFRYPEYWEDIEETPAHILLHTFSGQGYHYRQCFRDGKLLWDEYDAIFAQGHGGDDPTYMALLCLDRLRYPWQLEPQARKAVPGLSGPAGGGGGRGPDQSPGPGGAEGPDRPEGAGRRRPGSRLGGSPAGGRRPVGGPAGRRRVSRPARKAQAALYI